MDSPAPTRRTSSTDTKSGVHGHHGTKSPPPPPPPPPTPAPEPTPIPAPELLPPPPILGTGAGWEGFGSGSEPLAGWRPYASTSPFNMPATGAPVGESAAIVSRILSWGTSGRGLIVGTGSETHDYGHPIYWAEPTNPEYTLHFTKEGGNPLEGHRVKVPIGARPAGGTDGHMGIIQPNGEEIDLWQAKVPREGKLEATWGGGKTSINSTGLGAKATASNFDLVAGVIRPPELVAGQINHALFLVVKHTKGFVYPATHAGSEGSEPGTPPMGAHLRLNMTDAEIEALSVPPYRKAIARAMAHYGGYVGDTGGSGLCFGGESELSYTAAGLADPLIAWAQKEGFPKGSGEWAGSYSFDMSSGIPWTRMSVISP